MEQKHHYADYQQKVNEATGNVKGHEPKQPKNNQNRCDYSKHVFNSFDRKRGPIRNPFAPNRTISGFSLDSYLCQ